MEILSRKQQLERREHLIQQEATKQFIGLLTFANIAMTTVILACMYIIGVGLTLM